ncbi:hypothetical protein CGRA01v4_07671 [Colletotrichum graminicola]|nr:hypothetical protein CGRA01v4_07671 [Colletotrichum graminicola]
MKGAFSSNAFFSLLGPVHAAPPHAFLVEAYTLPGRTPPTRLPRAWEHRTLSHLPDPTLGTGLIFDSGLCLDLWVEPHPPSKSPFTRHLDMDDSCPLCRGFHHRRRGCLLCISPTTCSEPSSSVPTSSQVFFLSL